VVIASPMSALLAAALCVALRSESDDYAPAASAIGPGDCLKAARERNPDCAIAREEIERARASVDEAEHGNSPHVLLNSRYVDEGSGLLDTSSGLGTFGSRYSSSLYVEQSFLRAWRERTLSMDYAAASVLEARATSAAVETAVLADVLAAYVGALEAEARVRSTEARLASLRGSEETLRGAVDRGAALERDLVRLRESIAATESERAAARADAGAARSRLGRACGIEIADGIELLPIDAAAPDLAPDALVAAAIAGRSDLAAIRARIASKEKEPALLGNGLPDAAIGVGYEGRGDTRPIESSGVGVRLRLDYALGTSGVVEARRSRARAELRQLRIQESDLVRRIADEIADAQRTLDSVGEARRAAASALAAREEELRVLHARESAATPPSLLDLADAEARAEEARWRVRLADFDRLRALLRLSQAAGVPMDRISSEQPAPKPAAAAEPRRRALWAWRTTFVGDGADPDPTHFLDFCAARRIGTVFLSLGSDPEHPDLPFDLAAFSRDAAARGIAIDWLVGDPSHLDGKARAIDAALRAAARLAAGGGSPPPSAIHLDVEPQAHGLWAEGDRSALVDALVARVRATKKDLSSAAPSVHLAADLHPSFAERLIPEVDEPALMIYAGDADRVMRIAAPLLDAAANAGKRAWVGIKVDPAGDPAESLKTAAAAEDAMRRIEERFRDHPGFRGVAIHHAATYRRALLNGTSDAPANGER
jgi:outer membrane protein TolC